MIVVILGMTYTMYKRDKQLMKIQNRLNKFLDEQEKRQRETEEAKQTGNNAR